MRSTVCLTELEIDVYIDVVIGDYNARWTILQKSRSD